MWGFAVPSVCGPALVPRRLCAQGTTGRSDPSVLCILESSLVRGAPVFVVFVGHSVVCVCVCVFLWGGGNAILKRKACMGPGVGAQRRGPVPKRMSDEKHHDCTGPP